MTAACWVRFAEDRGPFAEAEIGGEDDAGALVELAQEMDVDRRDCTEFFGKGGDGKGDGQGRKDETLHQKSFVPDRACEPPPRRDRTPSLAL